MYPPAEYNQMDTPPPPPHTIREVGGGRWDYQMGIRYLVMQQSEGEGAPSYIYIY